MRFIKSIGILLLGIVIVVIGHVYDVLFAGISYQDPTPELQARCDFHSSVAGIFYKTGGIVFLAAWLDWWPPVHMENGKKEEMPTSRSSGRSCLAPLSLALTIIIRK
jgi:hypothetical protein